MGWPESGGDCFLPRIWIKCQPYKSFYWFWLVSRFSFIFFRLWSWKKQERKNQHEAIQLEIRVTGCFVGGGGGFFGLPGMEKPVFGSVSESRRQGSGLCF